MYKKTRRRQFLYLPIILIVFILSMGVFGYHFIEGFSFIEALYMTIITITTVGFGEVNQLSDEGRIFTIILIFSGLSVFTYAISQITSHFIEGRIADIFKKYKGKSRRKMKNHIIVIGYGRNGKQTANELECLKNNVLVVENNHDLVLEQIDHNRFFLEGDATEDETLLRAGIMNAKALITTLPNDADNLFIVLTARSLNPDLIIISRASTESAEKKLRIAGVSNIVFPEQVGGVHMARLVARKDIVEFLEHLSIRGSDPTSIEEVSCDNIDPQYINKSLSELRIRQLTGANIIGFKTVEGEYIINPDPDVKIMEGAKIFILGTAEQTQKMKTILKK